MKQAPTHIKNIYYSHYIEKEKDFIALLQYLKEKDNLEEILNAIEQLRQVHSNYISTESIKFICEQSEESIPSTDYDDIAKQAESNLEAYEKLFYTLEKGVM